MNRLITTLGCALCVAFGASAQVTERAIRSASSHDNTQIVISPGRTGEWTINWAPHTRRSTYVTLRLNGVVVTRTVAQILQGNSGPVFLRSGVITQSNGRRSLRLGLPANLAPRGTRGSLTIVGPGTYDHDRIIVL